MSKIKPAAAQIVILSETVVEYLKNTPRNLQSPWIVPTKTMPHKHRQTLAPEWKKLCNKAKIKGAVIHDLRRTFGAKIARTAGLHVASRLLRHSDIRTTEAIYAPIDEEMLRAGLQNNRQ